MRRGQSGLVRSRWGLRAAVVLAVVAGLAFAPAAVLADDGEIVWGGAAPLTGLYAQAGTLGLVGMEAYVGYLNATGGINGRPVRTVMHDSGSVPEQAVAVFKQIMAEEENVVAFYGDSTTFIKLSAPEVNDRYQILMGGSSMATELADPDRYRYHFMTGPTYADMIGILLEYIASERETGPRRRAWCCSTPTSTSVSIRSPHPASVPSAWASTSWRKSRPRRWASTWRRRC